MKFRSLIILLILLYAAWLGSCTHVPTAATPADGNSGAAAPATAMSAATKSGGEDYCFTCHQAQEGVSVAFKDDVHYRHALSCTDCHGGDARVNDRERSKAPEAGFRLPVQRQDVPTFCAGCHGNARYMAQYQADLPTNQIALYGRSAHGKALAAGNTKAAECIDCHGIHNIRPAGDPQSPANPRNLNATCVKCHAEQAALLRQNRAHANRTNCVMCHTGGHTIQTATAVLLTGANQGCGRCHRGNSRQAQTAAQIAQFLANLENAGPQSKDALARARRAVHSFNLGAVQRAANTPAAQAAADDRATRAVSMAVRSSSAPVVVPTGARVSDHR